MDAISLRNRSRRDSTGNEYVVECVDSVQDQSEDKEKYIDTHWTTFRDSKTLVNTVLEFFKDLYDTETFENWDDADIGDDDFVDDDEEYLFMGDDQDLFSLGGRCITLFILWSLLLVYFLIEWNETDSKLNWYSDARVQQILHHETPSLYIESDVHKGPIEYQGAVPLFSPEVNKSHANWEKWSSNESGNICVNNPELLHHITLQGLDLDLVYAATQKGTVRKYNYTNPVMFPECRFRNILNNNTSLMWEGATGVFNDTVQILTLKTTESPVRQNLDHFGFTNVQHFKGVRGTDVYSPFRRTNKHYSRDPLRPGELGIRDSFLKIFSNAISLKLERIWVFEDDVVFSENALRSIQDLLEDNTCGKYMFHNETGGVFLLGASDYSLAARTTQQDRKCYNVRLKTYGAFAGVYHRNVFERIVYWLTSSQYAGLPFDHIYGFLALEGFTVRVASRYIALADVLHGSLSSALSNPYKKDTWFNSRIQVGSVLGRACRLNWDLFEFPHYQNFLTKHNVIGSNLKAICNQQPYLYDRDWQITMVIIVRNPEQLVTLTNHMFTEWFHEMDGRYGLVAHYIVVLEDWPNPSDDAILNNEKHLLKLRSRSKEVSTQQAVAFEAPITNGNRAKDWTKRLTSYSNQDELIAIREYLSKVDLQPEERENIQRKFESLIAMSATVLFGSKDSLPNIAESTRLYWTRFLHVSSMLDMERYGLPSSSDIRFAVEQLVSSSTRMMLFIEHEFTSISQPDSDNFVVWKLSKKEWSYSLTNWFGWFA